MACWICDGTGEDGVCHECLDEWWENCAGTTALRAEVASLMAESDNEWEELVEKLEGQVTRAFEKIDALMAENAELRAVVERLPAKAARQCQEALAQCGYFPDHRSIRLIERAITEVLPEAAARKE